MPYDDVVKCPCGKSWVPKGFEHQCPYCKGKKPLPDLWKEMCNAKPSYPVDMTTPTNSKPVFMPLTPKKEVVRINLPPKPFSGEPVGSKSVNVAADFKLDKAAWEDAPSLNDVYEEVLGDIKLPRNKETVRKQMEAAFDALFGDPPVKPKNSVAMYHSRSNFYRGRVIYWYSFSKDSTVPDGFLKVPCTSYYEFGGTHEEAIHILKWNVFSLIVEGEAI